MNKKLSTVILSTAILLFAFTVLSTKILAFSSANGYLSSDKTIVSGNIVSISQINPEYVIKTNLSNDTNIAGVVDNHSLITQNNFNISPDVFVSSNGPVPTYVSNLNGNIIDGSYICPSPINGVGMYCSSGDTIGKALESMTLSNSKAYYINSLSGKSKVKVYIERIPILINIEYIASKNPTNGTVNDILSAIGDPITGKPISLLQLILIFVIILSSIVFSGITIYRSSVNSTISIGRNPMAKEDIQRVYYITVFVSIAIVILALIISFLLIKF